MKKKKRKKKDIVNKEEEKKKVKSKKLQAHYQVLLALIFQDEKNEENIPNTNILLNK